MATNPCSCFSRYTSFTPSTTSSCDDCIRLGTLLVTGDDAADPCGGTGTVSFDCFCYGGCNDGTVTFTVLDISPVGGIVVDSITSTGMNYTSAVDTVGGDRVEVLFKAVCNDTGLSDHGKVIIYLNNLCTGVDCATGQVCDQCAGTCVADEIDLEVT